MGRRIVSASRLNVRKEPKVDGVIVGVLHHGDVVNVLQTSEDKYWYSISREDGLTGWSSHKYLASMENDDKIDEDDLPWLPIAIREIGIHEYVGAANNPRIVEYLRSTALGDPFNSKDETPWCSAFVNWCVEKAGYEGTDSAWARSWAKWGHTINTPVRGCITVFTREKGGHVGFYMNETATHIELLGGNQKNSVCISNYPKSRLISYQLP
ncbi:MAG: TIGR02594 family protein [Desulfatibacillum sp.]|nr:TIGR02594 family protein [Desulfatibacillum sp.]